MLSFLHFLTGISPFLIFPYIFISVFVIAYSIHKKCMILREIKNPYYSIDDDLSKVKKDLSFKSMVCTFIIILSVLEFVINISSECALLIKYDLEVFFTPINVSNNCTIRDPNLLGLVENSHLFGSILFNISVISSISILPLGSIFLTILRKIYFERPYPTSMRVYAIFLVFRFLVLTILYCLMQTWYVAQLSLLPFVVIDLIIYISNSFKFYSMLKSIRNGVQFHSFSSESELIAKERSVKQFFYSQILIVIVMSIQLMGLLNSFISVPLNITVYNPCFLSYISHSILPMIEVSQHIRNLSLTLLNYCNILIYLSQCVVEGGIILCQLAVFISIIIKLMRRRRKFNHIAEEITRPLMAQYRGTDDSFNSNSP